MDGRGGVESVPADRLNLKLSVSPGIEKPQGAAWVGFESITGMQVVHGE